MTMLDCIVIGGGPAGLTAALYLARFRLSVRVYDAGRSRADWIPRTRNVPGYADGIPGRDLRLRMREHALAYGAVIKDAEVTDLTRDGDKHFTVTVDDDEVSARAVLLATGVVNNWPEVADGAHDDAMARGLIRYCPVCDGYEVTDKRVAILGTGERGTAEALFLRSYTDDVTLVAPGQTHDLHSAQRAALDAAGIGVRRGDGASLVAHDDTIEIAGERFDTVYPALGSIIRSDLAIAAGATANEDGCMEVTHHQETSVPGLFAAGDVVFGLDQIAVCMGQGAIAATRIRNWLAGDAGLRR